MYLILAIIKPHKLDAVRHALSALGIEGLTVSQVKGFGRQKGQIEIYRGAEYEVNYRPKIKLELAVKPGQLDEAVEAILLSAPTGQIGDGKIFVLGMEEALRIRTGERGEPAL